MLMTTQQPGFFQQPGHFQQPGLIQQPVMSSQPVFMQGQPVLMNAAYGFTQQVPGVTHPAVGINMAPGVGMNAVPVVTGNPQTLPPDVAGIGKTGGEIALEQCQFAYANGLFEPQDFKPKDDDPSRYYPVREVDGNWTQRNRFTIDNLGDCVWFCTPEGYFYAVRQPN
jgi:hypothetical protein